MGYEVKEERTVICDRCKASADEDKNAGYWGLVFCQWDIDDHGLVGVDEDSPVLCPECWASFKAWLAPPD